MAAPPGMSSRALWISTSLPNTMWVSSRWLATGVTWLDSRSFPARSVNKKCNDNTAQWIVSMLNRQRDQSVCVWKVERHAYMYMYAYKVNLCMCNIHVHVGIWILKHVLSWIVDHTKIAKLTQTAVRVGVDISTRQTCVRSIMCMLLSVIAKCTIGYFHFLSCLVCGTLAYSYVCYYTYSIYKLRALNSPTHYHNTTTESV